MPRKRNKNKKSSAKGRPGLASEKSSLRSRQAWPGWKRLGKVMIAITSALPFTLMLSSVGAFRHFEMPTLDALMHLREAPQDSDVMIVRINQEDYKIHFDGKSPLDPVKLQDIINKIGRGKPKVIGVDINTSAPGFQNLRLEPGIAPVVWAREATYSDRDKKFFLGGVLGGTNPAPSSGLMTLRLDSDQVVRRYRRFYETDKGAFPSLAQALVKAYRPAMALAESQDEMLIQFVGDPKHSYRFDLPVSKILGVADDLHWPDNGILKDKIVLLGGDYAGEDEHSTPLGRMKGVEVLAQIVETELRGGGVRAPGAALIILLGAIDGFLLWLILNSLSARISFVLSIPVILALSFLGSLLAFRSVSQWAYFVPVLAIVLGQQVYERIKEWQKKRNGANPVAKPSRSTNAKC